MLSHSTHQRQAGGRSAVRLLAATAVVGGLAATFFVAGASAGAMRSTGRAEIAGTVRLFGCVPDRSQLSLVATLMGVRAPEDRVAKGPKLPIRAARLLPTNDPHVVTFSIRGVQPTTLYRLGITYPEDRCGKVFWRGPFDGLVTPGSARVQVEGLAARTTIEVLQEGTDQWLGGDELRLMDGRPAERQFRWRSTLPGVTGGELQIALDPFPTDGLFDPCAEPPGAVVYRQPVDASDGVWVDIGTLDLSAILSSEQRDVVGEVVPITPSTYRSLVAGRPIYVRIVPETADGPMCNLVDDGASAWVLLGSVPETSQDHPPLFPSKLAPDDGNQYLPPYTLGFDYGPSYGEYGYKVIKEHTLPSTPVWCTDPLGCAVIQAGLAAPGTVLKEGDWFVLLPHSASGGGGGGFNPLSAMGTFTSTITQMTTGELSALGLLVDGAAKLWTEIKKEVVKAVVSVIQTLPFGQQGCDAIAAYTPTSCESIVETGLTVALASAGIPPSIPNWQQLKEQGIKYAAAEVATEIAGETGGTVPAEITQPMLEELAKAALDKMTDNRGGSDPKYNWVAPYLGFDPASLLVSIQKTGTGFPPEDLQLLWPSTSLFRGDWLPLPRIFPDDGRLSIPIVLRPNTAGSAAPLCLNYGWPSWDITCTPAPILAVPKCQGWSFDKKTWVDVDCTTVNWPQIYYRNRWIIDRLNPISSCTPISAATVIASTQINIDDLFHPFKELQLSAPPLDWRYLLLAGVRPRVAATWNGPTYFAC